MLTPEQLKELSDEEVCETIALLKNPKAKIQSFDASSISSLKMVETIGGFKFPLPRYTSNPNDIMPIAFENEISYTWSINRDGECVALGNMWVDDDGLLCGDGRADNKNPLRAICECFILMSQGVDGEG